MKGIKEVVSKKNKAITVGGIIHSTKKKKKKETTEKMFPCHSCGGENRVTDPMMNCQECINPDNEKIFRRIRAPK